MNIQGQSVNMVEYLEHLKSEGKKVVSIDFMIKELRGIPPTHQQTVKIVPVIDSIDVDGYLHEDIMERLTMTHRRLNDEHIRNHAHTRSTHA